MSFKTQNFCHVASNNRNKVKAGVFVYRTTDDLAAVTASGYFNERIIDINLHDIIIHEQIDSLDPTKVKQNFLCVVQKTLTNVTVKLMDTDEVDGANTDLSNLSETGKANISAKGTFDASATYGSGTVGDAIKGKANTDLDNLTAAGANIANWSSNVSNCIIEIPQDINLTLSNGTLTIKSGSKVYKPNGSGVFDTYVITADKTYTFSSDGTYMMYLQANNILDIAKISNVFSGDTTPTVTSTYALWYDTANNLVKKTNDTGATWSTGAASLPICVFTVSDGAISSIDQVFNGFGFIGSTAFVLPGVKALAPNGRNSDGTLKNELCVSSSVQIKNNLTATVGYTIGLRSNGTLTGFFDREYVTEEYPVSQYRCWYKTSENKIYNTQSAQGGEIQDICAILFYVNTTTEEFIPKYAFHAVDYSTEFIAHQAMPSGKYTALTLPASNGTLTAPADGYYTLNKQAGNSGEYIFMINEKNNINMGAMSPSALNARLFIPVSAGDIIKVTYTFSGTTHFFRFVYANGAA